MYNPPTPNDKKKYIWVCPKRIQDLKYGRQPKITRRPPLCWARRTMSAAGLKKKT